MTAEERAEYERKINKLKDDILIALARYDAIIEEYLDKATK